MRGIPGFYDLVRPPRPNTNAEEMLDWIARFDLSSLSVDNVNRMLAPLRQASTQNVTRLVIAAPARLTETRRTDAVNNT